MPKRAATTGAKADAKKRKVTAAAAAAAETKVANDAVTVKKGAAKVAEAELATPSSSTAAARANVRRVEAKSGASVDRNCFSKLSARVRVHVLTENDGTSWSAMLNQTNLAENNNKFYVIQLLESDEGDYYVYFRWGRVGKVGQDQLQTCGTNLAKAKAAFESKFYDKTRNNFTDRATFQKVPGKYDLIDVVADEEDDLNGVEDEEANVEVKNESDGDAEEDTKPAASTSRKSAGKKSAPVRGNAKSVKRESVSSASTSASHVAPVPSKLEKHVQHFLDEIFDRRVIEQTVRELDYDTDRLPLGRLTAAQIKAGYEALREIEQILDKGTHGSALTAACSAFYTKIPHSFGMRRPPLITSKAELRAKLELLETLETVCVTVRITNEVRSGSDKASNSQVTAAPPQNPLDAYLERLECEVRFVDEKQAAFEMIKRYVESTHGSTHNLYKLEILECYEVTRKVEADAAAYRESVGGRRLLWHGTRRSNLAGILKTGLRIAPPEAPITGWMFDKGIYFADCVTKSANYCHANTEHNEHYVMLCEVALGRSGYLVESDYSAKRNVKADSVFGVGMWTPDERNYERIQVPVARDAEFSALVEEQKGVLPTTSASEGSTVTIPIGPLVRAVKLQENALVKDRIAGRGLSDYVLNYNEYVVYDVRQVRMRYAVKVRFNFG